MSLIKSVKKWLNNQEGWASSYYYFPNRKRLLLIVQLILFGLIVFYITSGLFLSAGIITDTITVSMIPKIFLIFLVVLLIIIYIPLVIVWIFIDDKVYETIGAWELKTLDVEVYLNYHEDDVINLVER